jgi:CHRD domain
MRRGLFFVVVAVSGFAAAGIGLGASGSAVKLTAKLDSRHETPAPKGASKGSGLFTATLSGRSLAWRLTFSQLTGKAVAAHVHLGRPGVAGPVAVPLCGPCASGAHGKVTVAAKVRSALVAGGAYVNVHTAKNPAGEIRGQITGGGPSPEPTPTGTTATTTTTSTTTTGRYG